MIITLAEAASSAGHPIQGVHAAEETVGGLFYNNYANGTRLTSGAVFGRLACKGAAAHARR